MACCGSKDKRTENIDKKIKDDKSKGYSQIKLLLLGTGGSGKSTVAKQLKIIHHQPGASAFSDDELNDYKHILHLNTVKTMKTLVRECERRDIKIPKELQSYAQFFETANPLSTALTPDLVPQLKQLWKSEAIKACLKHRNHFYIPECANYCFKNLDRMAAEDFVPTVDDVLRARQRTTGVIETQFVLDKFTFSLVDVGGQRSERRKWIHCFQNVTALLYCVAMDEYDMTLIEDDSVNRMVEALNVFEVMINSEYFANTSAILFLNKDDLFRKKIERVDMAKYFSEYRGGKDYEKGAAFLQKLFLSKNHFPDDKQIYPHITVAINTENIRFVFESVRDMIFAHRMRSSGMMVV